MPLEKQIEELRTQIELLQAFKQSLFASATIPFEVDKAFENRLSDRFTKLTQATAQGLANAPIATISDPFGGGTVDSEARAAINSILDGLQTLGLMQ